MNDRQQTAKTEAFLTELAALCERHKLCVGTLTGEELVVQDLSNNDLKGVRLMRDETFACLEERGKK